MIGEFNSRTGSLNDFITIEHIVVETIGIDVVKQIMDRHNLENDTNSNDYIEVCLRSCTLLFSDQMTVMAEYFGAVRTV